MNRRVFEHGAPDEAGFNGVDGGGRLGELALPVTVAWGEYENAEQAAICELLVERIPGARRVILPGTAHLPGLDAPEALVAAINAARGGDVRLATAERDVARRRRRHHDSTSGRSRPATATAGHSGSALRTSIPPRWRARCPRP